MSQVQIVLDNIQLLPVRFPETRLVAALAGTTNELYSEFSIIEPYLVWLESMSFDRNATVQSIVRGTVADKSYENILSFGTAWPVLDDELPVHAPFDYDARVYLYNSAAGAIANYQGRVNWKVQPYTVADKLSMGIKYENLDSNEKLLADKYYVLRSILGGKLPMEWPKGDLQDTFIGNYAGNPAAGNANEINLLRKTVPIGYKMVLTKAWANRPAANFGNLEMRVYQDKRLVLTMFPFCFPNWGTATRYEPPIELWIPATQEMRVTLWSGTGHVGITAACEFEQRRLTIWDKMLWGLDSDKKMTTDEERTMISELSLKDKLNAGIYELVTPLPAVLPVT